MTLYPSQASFTRGEISPRLHARVELDLYRSALATCENFITLPHGGIRKRGGTTYVSPVKTPTGTFDKPRLIPFIFSEDQSYVLEFGGGYFRVFTQRGRVEVAGVPVEVVTPFLFPQLPDIQYAQSADVLYLTHPGYQLSQVVRAGNESWSWGYVTLEDGPFQGQNIEEATTVYASAATGTGITLTASAAIFTNDMIGRQMRLEIQNWEDIRPWEPGQLVAGEHQTDGATEDTPTTPEGVLRRYDSNIYACVTVAGAAPSGSVQQTKYYTGATPPTHVEGVQSDGQGSWDHQQIGTSSYADQRVGLDWEFVSKDYGVVEITAVAGDGLTATADVVGDDLPAQVVGSGNATYRWAAGVFPDQPRAVAIFEERLMLADRLSVYGSQSFNFVNFAEGPEDDDALNLRAISTHDITWLAEQSGFLLIGTIGGVRSLSGSGADEALTPSSFKGRASPTEPCSSIMPIDAGAAFVYVARGRKRVLEVTYDFQRNSLVSADLTVISEHIPKPGVAAIGYQGDPEPIFWSVLDDGTLGAMTYQREQDVRGWHRHKIEGVTSAGIAHGAVVESIAVTPGTGEDDIWLVVRRVIDGTLRRWMEVLTSPIEYAPAEDGFFVDAGLSYSGVPVGTVTGLSHLGNNTPAHVLADGITYRLPVVGGSVTLPGGATAGNWHVGFPYVATAVTLPLDAGARDGSLAGRARRVQRVILTLFETDLAGLEVRAKFRGNWEPIRIPSLAPVSPVMSLFTGSVSVPLDDSWEGNGQIEIRHASPGPCTILAITPAFDSEGA